MNGIVEGFPSDPTTAPDAGEIGRLKPPASRQYPSLQVVHNNGLSHVDIGDMTGSTGHYGVVSGQSGEWMMIS